MEPTSPTPPSPLDTVMAQFLDFVHGQPNGFATGTQSRDAAAAVDVPDALVDAMFISARTRGLIAPDFNARGRTRWILSDKGLLFLDAHSPSERSTDSSGDNRDNI